MLWLNGIFWFGILPAVGFFAGDAVGGGWGALAVIGGLVGGVITQPLVHRWLEPISMAREKGHVGWEDPGSGGGPGGAGGP